MRQLWEAVCHGWIAALSELGRDSLNPPYKSSGEADRGQIISRQPVVAGCDAPEVLQSVERALDAPAQLVDTLAEAERLFPVAAIWNDRLGSALVQVLAQLGAIVGLVAEHPFRWLHSANEALCTGSRVLHLWSTGWR